MLTLGEACMKAGGLSSLCSFTSSHYHEALTDAWITGTELLLKESPIEVFQSYLPVPGGHDVSGGVLADKFCVHVVDQHHDHLVRFSFNRHCVSPGAIEHVCASCPRLEELFVTIKFTEMVYPPFFFRIYLQKDN